MPLIDCIFSKILTINLRETSSLSCKASDDDKHLCGVCQKGSVSNYRYLQQLCFLSYIVLLVWLVSLGVKIDIVFSVCIMC